MSESKQKKPWIPPWSIPVAALVIVILVSAGMFLYRLHLESKVAALESERKSLEELVDVDWVAPNNLELRCPPVLELDPAWAEQMPWSPGAGETLRTLDEGVREVRILDADGTPGPTVSWNPKFRVYDLSALEGKERESFYLGVLQEDGSWALTIPTNWPLPLCEPWITCTPGACADRCLIDPWEGTQDLPPASLPAACRRGA